MTCSAHRTEIGLELRAEYSRSPTNYSVPWDRDTELADKADMLLRTLFAKGFGEIAKV